MSTAIRTEGPRITIPDFAAPIPFPPITEYAAIGALRSGPKIIHDPVLALAGTAEDVGHTLLPPTTPERLGQHVQYLTRLLFEQLTHVRSGDETAQAQLLTTVRRINRALDTFAGSTMNEHTLVAGAEQALQAVFASINTDQGIRDNDGAWQTALDFANYVVTTSGIARKCGRLTKDTKTLLPLYGDFLQLLLSLPPNKIATYIVGPGQDVKADEAKMLFTTGPDGIFTHARPAGNRKGLEVAFGLLLTDVTAATTNAKLALEEAVRLAGEHPESALLQCFLVSTLQDRRTADTVFQMFPTTGLSLLRHKAVRKGTPRKDFPMGERDLVFSKWTNGLPLSTKILSWVERYPILTIGGRTISLADLLTEFAHKTGLPARAHSILQQENVTDQAAVASLENVFTSFGDVLRALSTSTSVDSEYALAAMVPYMAITLDVRGTQKSKEGARTMFISDLLGIYAGLSEGRYSQHNMIATSIQTALQAMYLRWPKDAVGKAVKAFVDKGEWSPSFWARNESLYEFLLYLLNKSPDHIQGDLDRPVRQLQDVDNLGDYVIRHVLRMARKWHYYSSRLKIQADAVDCATKPNDTPHSKEHEDFWQMAVNVLSLVGTPEQKLALVDTYKGHMVVALRRRLLVHEDFVHFETEEKRLLGEVSAVNKGMAAALKDQLSTMTDFVGQPNMRIMRREARKRRTEALASAKEGLKDTLQAVMPALTEDQSGLLAELTEAIVNQGGNTQLLDLVQSLSDTTASTDSEDIVDRIMSGVSKLMGLGGAVLATRRKSEPLKELLLGLVDRKGEMAKAPIDQMLRIVEDSIQTQLAVAHDLDSIPAGALGTMQTFTNQTTGTIRAQYETKRETLKSQLAKMNERRDKLAAALADNGTLLVEVNDYLSHLLGNMLPEDLQGVIKIKETDITG